MNITHLSTKALKSELTRRQGEERPAALKTIAENIVKIQALLTENVSLAEIFELECSFDIDATNQCISIDRTPGWNSSSVCC